MKVYTKTGDKGTTLLIGGTRVPKHDIKIDAYGTVDELNAYLGLLRDKIASIYQDELIQIQNRLFTLGSFLALDPDKAKLSNGKARLDIKPITQVDIDFLEHRIDTMDQSLSPMTHFVLPGGHEQVSICHICRTVCRRAERKATLLNELSPVPENLITYLNRLSDYLFVLARKLSMDLKVEEIPWIPK